MSSIEEIAQTIADVKPRVRGRPRGQKDLATRRREWNAEYYKRTKDKFAEKRRTVASEYYYKKLGKSSKSVKSCPSDSESESEKFGGSIE